MPEIISNNNGRFFEKMRDRRKIDMRGLIIESATIFVNATLRR